MCLPELHIHVCVCKPRKGSGTLLLEHLPWLSLNGATSSHFIFKIILVEKFATDMC